MYLEGTSATPQDNDTALKYFTKAADKVENGKILKIFQEIF